MIVTNEYHETAVAIFQKPKASQKYSGDRYLIHEVEDGLVCALADGLGSGERAKESADAVMTVIEQNLDLESERLIHLCNTALLHRRGVVLGILRLDYYHQKYDFLSIGNIGLIIDEQTGKRKRFLPERGYLAGYYRPFKEETGHLSEGANFLMFTDGVLEQELSEPFMKERNVQTIVNLYAALYGNTRMDDTTLIALKYNGSS